MQISLILQGKVEKLREHFVSHLRPRITARHVREAVDEIAKYSAKDPFFKKVAESQKKFAALTVPYWTKLLGLYLRLGEAAIKK